MRSFEDGKWIAKALKRDKHRETFNELHESLSYIFQVNFLLMSGLRLFSLCPHLLSTCHRSLAAEVPYIRNQRALLQLGLSIFPGKFCVVVRTGVVYSSCVREKQMYFE